MSREWPDMGMKVTERGFFHPDFKIGAIQIRIID